MKKIYVLAVMLFLSISATAQVVISQVYGGGGNSGATYNKDFVELFNKGTAAVDISGWSIQYQSATNVSSPWNFNVIPASTTIQPGKYFLIAFGTPSATNGVALPAIDFDYVSGTPNPIAMSGTAGRVALVNTNTALPMGCNAGNANIVDLVGFGPTTVCSETAPTAILSSSLSAQRLNAGCTDNNNNSTDFSVAVPAPRNSATATNVCSTAPSLSIASPSNNASFAPGSNVSVSISVSNFVVGNPGTGIDGHIHYILSPGGSMVMKYDTTPIVFSGLAAGTYTLAVGLVDNSHQPINPVVGATVTFVIEPLNVVADLAALRADVTANGVGKYYQISSNPVVTYARPSTTAARYQVYMQDASAGILIDDLTNILATNVAIGDAISGFKGKTTNFNGLLQINPISDATVASTGNTVTPQVVTASAILANVEMYESELVQVNNVTFPAGTFATSTNYTVNDGSDITFRTLFAEADYITQAAPTTAVNLVGLVGDSTTGGQITARTSADFLPLSTNQFQIDGFQTYPNPVTNGVLNISTTANDSKSIEIFDVTGKQVLNLTTSQESINVSNLKTGVYMLKVTENNKVSTQKLMIQ